MGLVVRIAWLALSVALSGCVTTQGGAGASSLLKPLGLEMSDLTDTFSSQMREVKRHVDAGKFAAAEQVIRNDLPYFTKRLADRSSPLPPELKKLGEHRWAFHYAVSYRDALPRLAAITGMLDRSLWADHSAEIRRSRSYLTALENDTLLHLLRQGEAERHALRIQLQRVLALATASRAQALALTFDDVLNSATSEPAYPDAPFVAQDYLNAEAFQSAAVKKLAEHTDRSTFVGAATKLLDYLAPVSRELLDRHFSELVRREVLADGRVSLDEMASYGDVKSPFGSTSGALTSLVKVGYIDLTAASFKNRNMFDFAVSFKQDLALAATAADEGIFRTANWNGYDYLFITDLAVAKVARDFKSRKAVKSRARTGERQEQNPNYISALSAYQQAMAEYQRAQLSTAAPRGCTGWGCVAQALADGLVQGAAKNKVDRASQSLAQTSQTVSIPVFSEYTYQSVDISTSKTADVNYYVVDVKGQRILRSNFQVNDQESFNVAYEVRDEDPDRASILRNVTSEDEVIRWEKQAIEVPLSTLFSTQGLRSATVTPLTDVQTFLASLQSREALAAAPTYTDGRSDRVATGTAPPGATQVAMRPAATGPMPAAAQTIADERFDSVVIIQSPNSIGTGFYVTPELVLTAYHVVRNNALVQMTFYDGTKTFGRVVDHDVRLDLALVRAQATGKPLKIHSGPLRLGETVEAIGHPRGFEFTISRGVISAVRRQRSVVIGSDALVEFVQTDTPLSPGNSGGPLLLRDAVIGVNDWVRHDKGSQNLNFSVSFNEIRAFLDRVLAK